MFDRFEFYVMNYDWNKKEVFMYNIFNNIVVNEWTLKAIKKYIRSPKKYKYYDWHLKDNLYGFEALCKEIRSILMYQLRSRVEYEIEVGDAYEDDINKFERWDCFQQCEPNIPVIARECIYQYKQYLKEKKNDNIKHRDDNER